MGLDRIRLALALLVLLLASGCTDTSPTSSDATKDATWSAPANRGNASQSWNTFYPLAVGNRWRSTRAWSGSWVGDGDPPWPAESGGEDYEFEQICTEVRGGVPYIVEEQRIFSDSDSGASHVRYRQNETGLYEADVCLCEPPDCSESSALLAVLGSEPIERFWEKIASTIPDPVARAAAKERWDRFSSKLAAARQLSIPLQKAAGASELTRLKYPLFPGQNWAIRNDPSFTFKAGVEVFEFVDLPVGRVPAYRVRVSPPIDPQEVFDYVQWWGPCGFMGAREHAEFEWMDGSGQTLVFVWDALQQVTEIDLVDRRACTIAEE